VAHEDSPFGKTGRPTGALRTYLSHPVKRNGIPDTR
jgi:hypothetical protein